MTHHRTRTTENRSTRPDNVQAAEGLRIHGDLPTQTVVEAEKAVLGACMLYPERGIDVLGQLYPSHFWRASHRNIFRALKAVLASGTAPDLLLVTQELRKRGELKKAGGVESLSKIVHSFPVMANLEAHIRTVRKAYRIRQGMQELQSAIREAQAGADVEEELTGAITRLSSISEQEDYFDDYNDPADLFSRYVEPDEVPAASLQLGIPAVDEGTSGWGPGSLMVIGGPPKIGKTALASQIVLANPEAKTAWFSAVEVPRDQLYRRFLSAASGVPHERLTAHKEGRQELSTEQAQAAMEAAQKMSMSLRVYWESALDRITGACQVLSQTRGLDLVIVDHVHNVQTDPRVARGYQRIPHRLLQFRELAKRLQCVVILLAHLRQDWNRHLAKDGRPTKESLRDGTYMSGTPTHVYLWHYPDWDQPEAEADRTKREFVICDERGGDGIRKILPVYYQGECYRLHPWPN